MSAPGRSAGGAARIALWTTRVTLAGLVVQFYLGGLGIFGVTGFDAHALAGYALILVSLGLLGLCVASRDRRRLGGPALALLLLLVLQPLLVFVLPRITVAMAALHPVNALVAVAVAWRLESRLRARTRSVEAPRRPPPTVALFVMAALAPLSAAAQEARHGPEVFLKTTVFRDLAFTFEGAAVLVSSDAGGTFDVWAVPVEDGEPIRRTEFPDDARLVGAFPADDRVLVRADDRGNERDHLFVLDPEGRTTDLTPGPETRAVFHGWSADGHSFFVATNERDPRYFDLWEIETDGYGRTLVFRDTTGYEIRAVSGDGRHVALVQPVTQTGGVAWLHERGGTTRPLLDAARAEGGDAPRDFSADGRFLYYTTDRGSDFDRLERIDLETGDREVVLEPGWDVVEARVSRPGGHLVVSINEDARPRVRIFDPAGTEIALPDVGGARVDDAVVSPDGTRIAFYASGSRSPRDVWIHEVGAGEPRRRTRALPPEIDPEDLVDVRRVRFEASDGVVVSGLLYRPKGAGPENRLPVVVWIHGGPGGQARVGWSALIQLLVHHGYGVYEIDHRGSDGYGRAYAALDDGRHGEADLDDVVESKRMLVATDWVDPERIVVAGSSYGGFLTLAALAFRPEAFAAGIDFFGISNWERTIANIPTWWEAFREALEREMGDLDDLERFRSISPLFHAERIRRPLLVLQGANDPRVLREESDDIVAAVRANGVPVEYLVFEDEGHGFTRKENRLEAYRAILAFLDAHVGPRSAAR